MNVEIVETPELGDRSYVVDDGHDAVVIDPQRDLDRVERVLESRGVTVRQVLETHVHNDYLTGGWELARRTGAQYALNAADPVRFDRLGLHDGDTLAVGRMRIRVIATPGHTDTHLAYAVEVDGSAEALFSGGSLLFGAVGRTDLLDPARATELAQAQYRSAHRLATVGPETALYPTHGFGSFCAGGAASGGTASTIGEQTQKNPVFLAADAPEFATDLVASFGAYPTYYAHMAPTNLIGPRAVDLTATGPGLDVAAVRARLAAGETVVDLRDRVAYSAAHAPGTISIPLSDQFATYVGWLIPFGTRLTLVADDPDQLAAARRQLIRIGYDDIAGLAGAPTLDAPPRRLPRATFAEFAAQREPADVVLDVRRADETTPSRVRGARHIPVHEVAARLDTLPRQRIWVHCVSGFRAGAAASILANAGFEVIHIDDHIDHAVGLGLAE
jgi:hydroxyacylglutathione hydrolase